MNFIKDRIIRWAIKQIVGDGKGTYADMRYLEDVLENKWGEKMFIFSHRIVPINKAKMEAANAKQPAGAAAFQDAAVTYQSKTTPPKR